DPVAREDAVAVRVARRVAGVEADRVRSVRRADVLQPAADLADGLLPGDAPPRRALALHRMQDAIGVVGHLVEGDALGTRVAAREDVIGIGTEPRDAAVLDRRDHAAVDLADAAVRDLLLDLRHRRLLLSRPARVRAEPHEYLRVRGRGGRAWRPGGHGVA